jgi:uncharacterized protein involved in outer membrane biogenesis
MKLALLTLLVIALVVIIAAGVFIATFDINRYKGAIESQIYAAIGNPVELGRLSLGWNGNLVLGVDGIKIFSSEEGKRPVVLSVDRAIAAVNIFALAARRIDISSISLERPSIIIVKCADGRIEVKGCCPRTCAVTPPSGEAAQPAAKVLGQGAVSVGTRPAGFGIRSVAIKDGAAKFIDLSDPDAAEVSIRRLDAEIKDISTSSPARFAVKMALAGDTQDVALSGVVGASASGDISLKDFRMEADLSAFNGAEVRKALPALGRAGLRDGMAGKIKADIGRLEASAGKVKKLSGNFSLTGGRLVFAQLRVPVDNIALSVSAEDQTVTLKQFSANLSNGVLSGSARVDDVFSAPKTTLQTAIEVRGLNQFVSTVSPLRQNLDGDARISFAGSMAGVTWPEISRTLAGRGTISLENGIIMDANVLDDSLGALTMFPNMLAAVQGNAPAQERPSFSNKYTVLKPLNQQFTVEGGYIILPDLTLQSSNLDMRGSAKMSLTGDLSGSGMIRFSPAISGAIMTAVPQMRAIADPQGLITFPIAFKGGGGTFKVIPDTKYIGQKVAIQTAGDVISGYLKKAAEGDGSAKSAAADSSSAAKPPKIKDFLKALAAESQKSN